MAATHHIVPKSCREASRKDHGECVVPPSGYKSPVFISYRCCDELAHTWHLKTACIYFLTILEARTVKSRHWQSSASTGSSRKGSFFASFSFCASWCPRLVAASFNLSAHHHLLSVSPLPLSFKKTLVISWEWNQIIQDDLISRSLT